jgi:cell division protein FtsZ
MSDETLNFGLPTNSPKIIKVIGVGGGGSNAVKNMFKTGIHDVSFVLCNTDLQALKDENDEACASIPVKIQLGPQTCKGLGAGNDPEVACAAAEESIEQIRELFCDDTKMVFITAGMGGGTGTGASPVVARVAKEMGVLTVGIVTIPFKFEQRNKILQALKGVEAIAKNVDALLVVNNERLRNIYPNISVTEGFRLVDDTLTIATKSIAEIITMPGIINLDFRDVSKVLKNGGVSIMSYGVGSGEKRLQSAIENALRSPLLNDNDIYNSKKILFNIYQSVDHPLIVEELDELTRFMNLFETKDIEVIWGLAEDASLKEEVKITILATGFGVGNIPGMEDAIQAREAERKMQEAMTERERIDKEEQDSALIDSFYRDSTMVRRSIRSFIFKDDDLDDDSLIGCVESSVTLNRTSKELGDLEGKRQQTPVYTETATGEGDNLTIVF